LAYAAFPLQHSAGQNQPTESGALRVLTGDVKIEIDVRSAERGAVDEIRGACRAWLSFGGIGGRTRRGFGAVAPALSSEWNVVDWEVTPSTAVARDMGSIPRLAGAMCRRSTRTWRTAIDALGAGLALLRQFRQGENVARAPGPGNHPSYSYWPEPDTIRRFYPPLNPPTWALNSVQKFPRAAFGLPIIFEFKDAFKPSEKKSELTPDAGLNRWPSPLIIRPMREAPDSYRCVALALSVDRPTTVCLTPKVGPGLVYSPTVAMTAAESGSIQPMTLTGAPLQTDAVLAFLDYFSTHS